MEPDEVPDSILNTKHRTVKAVRFEAGINENKFSLAGVQMKFSMKEKDGRYIINPSTKDFSASTSSSLFSAL